MLSFDLLDGPHYCKAKAIRVIDFARWRVDEASHAYVRLVAMGNDRTDLVVKVPDCLALHACTKDV